MSLALYRLAAAAAAPFIHRLLARRARLGKEDPERIGERYGQSSAARPAGRLVWIHAASVGESLSMLSLVNRLAVRPSLSVLVTTGTVTSARLMAERLPAGAVHQYVPLDRSAWVRRFLDHWRPDLVLWVESEFWPNMLGEIGARGIPAILVNARISAKSFRRWSRARRTIGRLLANFDLCLAQSEDDADKLRRLGARSVKTPGNLKFAAAPLPADDVVVATLGDEINGRPTWLAASTHPGEEPVIASAHRLLRRSHPDALTIIVPRHPARGPDIASELRAAGAAVALRSAGEVPAPPTEIYVADSMGELGVFFRLARVAFMGGSLIRHGGQNPLEAASLGCPVIHGPHMTNFRAIADEMAAAGATAVVADAEAIAAEVHRLMADADEHGARIAAARAVATAKQGVLESVVGEIAPFLDPAAGGNRASAPDARA